MKYPYAKITHEEVVDGGWKFALIDMLWFSVKVFLFVAVAYSSVFTVALIFAQYLSAHLSPECIATLISISK